MIYIFGKNYSILSGVFVGSLWLEYWLKKKIENIFKLCIDWQVFAFLNNDRN